MSKKTPKAILANRLYVREADIDEDVHLPPFTYRFKERVFDELMGESVIVESEHAAYKHNEKRGLYGIHRGNLDKIRKVFRGFRIIDKRVAPPLRFRLKRRFKLEPEQKLVVGEWLPKKYGLIKAPVRWGKCVLGDTLIPTARGLLRMDEVIPNNGNTEKTSVVNVTVLAKGYSASVPIGYYHGSSKVLKVETALGYTESGTYEHPLLVLGKRGPDWKRLDEIKAGDFVAIQEYPITGAPFSLKGFVPSKPSLVKGAFTRNRLRLPGKFLPWMGRLFGYLVGDSCLSHPGAKFTNVDVDTVSDYTKLMHRLGMKVGSSAGAIEYYTYGIELDDFLSWSGCKKVTAHHKEVPWIVRRSGKEVVREFLRAYFETDGHPDSTGRVEISSVSRCLLATVQTLLLGFGIVSDLKLMKVKYTYKGKTTYRQAYRIRIDRHFAHIFHKEIGFLSARKKRMASLSLSKVAGKGYTNKYNIPVNFLMRSLWEKISSRFSYQRGRRLTQRKRKFAWCIEPPQSSQPNRNQILAFLKEFHEEGSSFWEYSALQGSVVPGRWWIRVSGINKVRGLASVYDLHVPKHHWFVGNGFVNHNTFVGMYLVSKLGVTSLLLSDKKHLCKQWLKHFYKRTNIRDLEKKLGRPLIGIYTKKDKAFFPITITTFQTLWSRQKRVKLASKNKNAFGFVFVDEAHHTPAETYGEVTSIFNAMYRCGVTATERRRDKKHYLLFDILGPVTGVGKKEQLRCKVIKHETDVHIDPKASWGWMTTLCTRSHELNEMIANQVVKDVQGGRFVLVHTPREKHCYELKEMIQDLDMSIKVGIAHGGVTIPDRDRLIRKMNKKKIQVIIGVNVIQEALTFLRADTIHVGLNPLTNPDAWEQITGRVRTPFDKTELEGETKPMPIIHDWRLKGHGGVHASGRSRDKLYHKKKWTVEEIMPTGFGSGSEDPGLPPVPRFCCNCKNFFACKEDEVGPKDEPCSSKVYKWKPLRITPKKKMGFLKIHENKIRGEYGVKFISSLASQNYSFWSRKQMAILHRYFEEVLEHPKVWKWPKFILRKDKENDEEGGDDQDSQW